MVKPRAIVAIAPAAVALAGGCAALLGIDAGEPQPAASTGAGGAGGMGGMRGAGGGAGAGGQGGVAQVALGAQHTCALKADGSVSCWGANDSGQLGLAADYLPHPAPSVVSGLPRAVQIALGQYDTCALDADGAVWCWGDDGDGQLGATAPKPSATPLKVMGLPGPAIAIAFGGGVPHSLSQPVSHGCALMADHSVFCWGDNQVGELGIGTADFTAHFTAARVEDLPAVDEIAAGAAHCCARTSAGQVFCWGEGQDGQIGDGAHSMRPRPQPVVNLPAAAGMALGARHSCAWTKKGDVWCWGYNQTHQAGDCGTPDCAAPAPVAVSGVTQLAAGDAHTCALEGSNGNAVLCWGASDKGQLGNNSGAEPGTPVPVLIGHTAQIAAGGSHTCARSSSGALSCWGDNELGEVGDGSATRNPKPIQRTLKGLNWIAAGANHTCAVTNPGPLRCWGRNASGQLGTGDMVDAHAPVALNASPSLIEQLALGDAHTCVRSGDAFCWGSNGNGQLGDGKVSGALLAFDNVASLKDAILVAAGVGHTCAVKNDQSVWCWGKNDAGQLGVGDENERDQPTVVPMLSDVVQLALGGAHSCAIESGGSVWCWGKNDAGQLGLTADAQAHPSPTRVVGLAARYIALGGAHSCAVATDQSVWCWGKNDAGQLGLLADALPHPSPAQVSNLSVPTVAGANGLALGDRHGCALDQQENARHKKVVTVRCWGANDYGQLGNGKIAPSASPSDVAGLGAQLYVAAGGNHSCAAIAGAFACWGDNSYGQLGDGGAGIEWLPVAVKGL